MKNSLYVNPNLKTKLESIIMNNYFDASTKIYLHTSDMPTDDVLKTSNKIGGYVGSATVGKFVGERIDGIKNSLRNYVDINGKVVYNPVYSFNSGKTLNDVKSIKFDLIENSVYNYISMSILDKSFNYISMDGLSSIVDVKYDRPTRLGNNIFYYDENLSNDSQLLMWDDSIVKLELDFVDSIGNLDVSTIHFNPYPWSTSHSSRIINGMFIDKNGDNIGTFEIEPYKNYPSQVIWFWYQNIFYLTNDESNYITNNDNGVVKWFEIESNGNSMFGEVCDVEDWNNGIRKELVINETDLSIDSKPSIYDIDLNLHIVDPS